MLKSEQAAGPLQQHTLGVNDVGTAFVKAARARGDECDPFSWRHEIAHPLGPPPGRRKPDQLIAEVRDSENYGPLVMHPLVGGMPIDEAWKSVQLLTDKVLPALS